MNVVYDLLGFQSRDHGERGIARYVLQLALALERTHPGLVTQYLMHPHLPFPAGAEALLASGKVTRTDRKVESRRPTAGGVFIAGSPFESYDQPSEFVLPTYARTPRWQSLAVVHDLVPAKFPDDYLTTDLNRQFYLARQAVLTKFDRLLANSQATADDTCEMLGVDPEHVTVIGAGADDRFRPPTESCEQVAEELAQSEVLPGLRPGYILFPTGIDPRKNIERAIRAYGKLSPELRRGHQLVLSCRLSEGDRVYVDQLADDAGVDEELLATGFVSDELLCRLYQGAHLVLFPSLYEGFGLPALEAMKCGAPVICADSSSLIEVQPLAEARFDPTSVAAIAAALQRGLADDDFRHRLRTQELPPFSWDNAARLTAEVIAKAEVSGRVGDRARPRHRSAKPRLAVFTPLPPQDGELAAYAYRLLEELRHHSEITVFASDDPGKLDRPEGVIVEPARYYEPIMRGGGAFDQVLYLVGNGPAHVDMLAAMRDHPGCVLFGDVGLTGLYEELRLAGSDELVEESVGATVAWMYPGRYRHEVEVMTTVPDEVAQRFGVLMAREVVARAERVLVHSAYGAALLEIDAGVDALLLGPTPCPAVAEVLEEPVGLPTISSFGPLTTGAQIGKLLRALLIVQDHVPQTRLRLVGEVDESRRRELSGLAREVGVARLVDFVDHLDRCDRMVAAAESAVAVQLRTTSTGEFSPEVPELMALGVPTIVSSVGAMVELPDDAVVKVDAAVGVEELAAWVCRLLTEPATRAELSEGAKRYAKANSYARAAADLAEMIF